MTNFTILKNEDILNTNISSGAFRCYSLLNQMYYSEKNTCFSSQQYLGEKLNKSIRSIQRYIIELVREGLITVKHGGSVSSICTISNKILLLLRIMLLIRLEKLIKSTSKKRKLLILRIMKVRVIIWYDGVGIERSTS